MKIINSLESWLERIHFTGLRSSTISHKSWKIWLLKNSFIIKLKTTHESKEIKKIQEWKRVSLIIEPIFYYETKNNIGGFLQVLWYPPPIKLMPRYNWNIVKSGVKHHNPNHPLNIFSRFTIKYWRSNWLFFILYVHKTNLCDTPMGREV